MTEDSVLLQRAEQGYPGWRVYGWDGPWISLGCFQDALKDLLDPELVPWVMRPTGGRAVLHGHDVTVGLALPLSLLSTISGIDQEKLSRSLRTVYRFAIAPIVEALRECGLPAVLGETLGRIQKGKERVADCFAVTSPNDIVHEQTGVKVCGCALKLTQKAVLVQASIPASAPLIDPRRVFGRPSLMPLSPWQHEDFSAAFEVAMRELVGREAVSL
jgi:lipoate-protein ligase A